MIRSYNTQMSCLHESPNCFPAQITDSAENKRPVGHKVNISAATAALQAPVFGIAHVTSKSGIAHGAWTSACQQLFAANTTTHCTCSNRSCGMEICLPHVRPGLHKQQHTQTKPISYSQSAPMCKCIKKAFVSP